MKKIILLVVLVIFILVGSALYFFNNDKNTYISVCNSHKYCSPCINMKDGKHKGYRSGKLVREYSCQDGKLNGSYMETRRHDGAVFRDYYINEKKHGLSTYHLKDGTLFMEKEYRDGINMGTRRYYKY
jgi:antitoxin component YwqK of YwqJK toxin-antitoxin module